MRSVIWTLFEALAREAPPTMGGGVDTSRVFLSTLTDTRGEINVEDKEIKTRHDVVKVILILNCCAFKKSIYIVLL